MKFAKVVFYVAGIYGLLVLVPMLFLETRIGVETPPAITHAEYFYGFVGVGVAWQVMFLMIAREPARYRLAMVPSVLEKFGFGIAVLTLFAHDRVSQQVLLGALADIFLGILFVASFVVVGRARNESR